MVEQPGLDLEAAGEAGELAVGSDHTVARDHDRYRVLTIGRADGTRLVLVAQRRGLLDESEANRNGKDANNIAEGFRISGLGQLIEMGIQTDRPVTFGD